MSVDSPHRGVHARLRAQRGSGFDLDVDVDIEPGTTVALLGPNGAGKSTTVELLAGLLPLDAGRIELAGRVLDDPSAGVFVPPEHRRIGVVFQQYLLFDHLTVLDNVAFGPMSRGEGRRAARTAARPWLAAMQLDEFADRRPRELSGGQAQRVAMARALASGPDLLLLDEPLAALDVATKSDLRRILATHLRSFDGPRLIITHDPTDAFLLADRIQIVENGRVTQTGTPADIRRRPATAYVAALAGTNLMTGTNTAGTLLLDGRTRTLQTSDTATSGPVLVTVHPTAIALHNEQPHGSPRNSWATSVATVEPLGDTTRVTLAEPLPLGVDVTPAAVAALGIEPGAQLWASVKATEVMVTPAS